MICAIIENNIVTNTIEAAPEHLDGLLNAFGEAILVAVDPGTFVEIGMLWDGEVFTRAPATPEQIAAAKIEKLLQIQARTAELRSIGFLYNGKRYSLEHDALRQVMEAKSWVEYDFQHSTSNFVYPLIWPSVDRLGFCYMVDGPSVIAFALAASLADRALTQDGAGLEMTLISAETLEDIAAIIDTRAPY